MNAIKFVAKPPTRGFKVYAVLNGQSSEKCLLSHLFKFELCTICASTLSGLEPRDCCTFYRTLKNVYSVYPVAYKSW